MAEREQRLAIVVLAKGTAAASAALRSVSKELGGLDKAGRYIAARGVRGVGTAIQNIERAAIGLGAVALGAGAAAVKIAGDFQAGMNTINTVALATPAALEQAGNGIRKVAKNTGASLQDLQASEYDLVSAGIRLGDAQAGLEQSVRLGMGAYGSTAEAVDVLTTAVNAYNLKAADGTVATGTWTKLSDELAQAVADGKVKLSEIAPVYADIAKLAQVAGIGTDQIAASFGYLTAQGVPAAEVTTQMGRAILELQKPSKSVLNLQDKLGKSYEKIAREKGLNVALQELRADTDAAHVPLAELFGRVEGYKYLLETTGPSAEGFNTELGRIRGSAGMTEKQFDERAQGLNFQVARFKANVMDAAITVGTKLIPQLADLAKEGADYLSAHPEQIEAAAQAIANGFRDAVKWAKSLDWELIRSTLVGAAGAVKQLVDAFMALPPGVQQGLIGGFAVNKLTGGAVTDIGGALVKGTLGTILGGAGGLLGRGGSPANPLWVQTVGGPLGGGLVGGAGGGGLANGLLRIGAGLGLGFLGTNLLSAGIGQGATPFGIAGGIGGGASMIGAGALLGGPIGAMIAAGLAVGQTAQETGARSQAQAAAIHQGLDSSMAGKSLAELQTALAATKTGISDIEGAMFGLGGVVHAGAIDELRKQQADIEAAIKEAERRNEQAILAAGTDSQREQRSHYDELNAGFTTIAGGLDVLHADFLAQRKILQTSKDPKAILAAAKAATADVEKGVGGPKSTRNLLAELKANRPAIVASGDKAALAEYDKLIATVGHYLSAREWIQAQKDAAAKIAASNAPLDRKLADLKVIENRLLARGDTNAANIVAALERGLTLSLTPDTIAALKAAGAPAPSYQYQPAIGGGTPGAPITPKTRGGHPVNPNGPGAASGDWRTREGWQYVHDEEAIFPAQLAERMRRFFDGGLALALAGGAPSSITFVAHVPPSVVTATDVNNAQTRRERFNHRPTAVSR